MTLKKSCHPKPAWAHLGWFFCCPLCKVRRHALAREKVNQEQESAIAAAIAAIQAELPRYGELDEKARALSALTRTLELQRGQLQRKSNELDEVKAGLELDVIDHYNGSIRSVKTLSGGESFKASLSLALGCPTRSRSPPAASGWTPCSWTRGSAPWTRSPCSRP